MLNHVKKVHIDNKCDGPPPEEIKILLAEEGEADFDGKLWTLKIFHDHIVVYCLFTTGRSRERCSLWYRTS